MIPTSTEMAGEFLAVAADCGLAPAPGMRILDFGCGEGALVSAFLERGFDAFGTDIREAWPAGPIGGSGRLRPCATSPYRIPFDDGTFDLVVSNSVFEHVTNVEESFREIRRVLRPGGATLHMFPGPWYLPAEPHIRVPLATRLHARWWLALWALLGVRNEFQRGMSWRETVRANEEYCRRGINYLPLRELDRIVAAVFGSVAYPKESYVRHGHGGAARLGRALPVPGYPSLVFTFRNQTVFARKTVP